MSVNSTRSFDGVDLVYDVLGRGDATIVLVHGWSNNRTFWQPHTQTLSRFHRVAALDLAGFGESGCDRREWSMRAFGEDVAAVARELPSERLVLVGFSMGGAAVLEAAKIIDAGVLGVVLVDVFQEPEKRYSPVEVEAWICEWAATWRAPAAVRKLGFGVATPDALIQRYIAATPASVPSFWWDTLRNFFRWSDTDLLGVLANTGAPVCAINSDRVPTNVAAFERYCNSFELHTMPGLGHLGVIWEEVELFDELLLEAAARLLERKG